MERVDNPLYQERVDMHTERHKRFLYRVLATHVVWQAIEDAKTSREAWLFLHGKEEIVNEEKRIVVVRSARSVLFMELSFYEQEDVFLLIPLACPDKDRHKIIQCRRPVSVADLSGRTIDRFRSIAEAAREYNLNYGTIRKSMESGCFIAKKYRFFAEKHNIDSLVKRRVY